MTSGREVPWRNAGLSLYSLGLTIAEIEAEWRPWCSDRQSRKKLDGVIRLLKKNEQAQSARHHIERSKASAMRSQCMSNA